MNHETSRKAFEAWAEERELDLSAWARNPDTYKSNTTVDAWDAWQASRKAMEAEQAQEVEPAGYWLERAKELVDIFEDAPSFSEVASKISVKQPLSTERAELIGRLKKGMKLTHEYGLTGTALVLQSSINMLESDISIINEGNKEQQVAVPAKREPLSDGQIDAVTLAQWGEMQGYPLAAHRAYARAIEAAASQPPQGDTQ